MIRSTDVLPGYNPPARRNCYKCGREFLGVTGQYVCPVCRAPKIRHDPRGELGDPLSRRERQVVAGIARMLRNKEIAAELHLSEGTIKEYVNRIFRKFGVSSRIAVARYAWEQERKAA